MYGFIKKRSNGQIRARQLEIVEMTKRSYDVELSRRKEMAFGHRAGISSLSIEKLEQRYLLSGGGDGKINLYDLQQEQQGPTKALSSTLKRDQHEYAVTSVHWYPFDTGMFVTSSLDRTVKLYDTESMKSVFTFTLKSKVNCASMSSIASHGLIACAASEPKIRLCDLNGGTSTHSLKGHEGSVLSCTWSTHREYILYSGGNDGTIRAWDIRSVDSALMSLDQDNAVDPLASTNLAHGKGVNGVSVTADGRHLVSLGLDEKIRLWDTETGHNTFVNYGNSFRNGFKFCLYPISSGPSVYPPLLYVPSDNREVLVFRLMDGVLIKRLKGAYGRVTCVEKREEYLDLYSGSNGGDIMIWEPPMQEKLEGGIVEDIDNWSDSGESL
ncbi:excision repair cross-complementing rodent repair deficiency, complementation group 8-like protein [Backusella circina FSU 941]|nr:excision repair cross-complementing rodent repair deficiency, complementation group 8-like protein [Backusella circina FSU 941]